MPKKIIVKSNPYEDRIELFKDAKSKKIAKELITLGVEVQGEELTQQNKSVAEALGVKPNKVQAVRRMLKGDAGILAPSTLTKDVSVLDDEEPPSIEEVDGVPVHDIDDTEPEEKKPTRTEAKKVRSESVILDAQARIADVEARMTQMESSLTAKLDEILARTSSTVEVPEPKPLPEPRNGNGHAVMTPGMFSAEVEGFWEKVVVPSSMRTLFSYWKAKTNKLAKMDPSRNDAFEGGLPEFFIMTAKHYFDEVGANLTYVEETPLGR